jgi:hypothetical protein
MKVLSQANIVRAGKRCPTSGGVESHPAGSSSQYPGSSPALCAFEAALLGSRAAVAAGENIGIQNGKRRSPGPPIAASNRERLAELLAIHWTCWHRS